MIKIHCIEAQREDFDKVTFEELQKMVGWIEPSEKYGTWDVTLADGNGFTCNDQATAQILSSIEEVKALLLEQRETISTIPQ